MQLSRLTTPNSSKSFIRLLILGCLMVCSGMLNTLSSSPSLAVPPNLNLDLQPNSFSNCGGFTASVTVIGSQVGYSYQLLNAGVPTGSPLNGTGGNIIITSGPINVSTTLTVRATELIAPFDTGILNESIPVTISQLPTTSNAGNNQVNCGLSIALNGNAPTVGTGTWTLVNGPGSANFNNPNQRNTLVTVSQQGTYTFQWSISNGVCPPSTDDVIITFFAPPTPADAGPNQLVCGLSATMQALAPTNGNGSWFLVSGPGGASFENSTDPNTNINVFTSGAYIFQWIVFNGVCPFSSDQVTITFTEDQVTSDAGPDQVVCALSTTLAANAPGAFSGAWTIISGPGTGTIASPTSPSTNFSADVAGVYILEWSIDNAPCPISSDQVAIEFTLTTEVCDGIDNDCDTQIDEGFDVDGDGFTSCGGDCNDNDNTVFPGAPELCDGIDNDCDTDIDEGVTITFYADLDGDTFGDPLNTIEACSLPIGYVTDNTDCDDTNAAINSAAVEICDGVDNNCNTQIDEGVTTTYYADVDGDTFGDPLNTVQACTQPVGFVLDNTDCDDTNPAINTGAVETCDGVDNNCNTQIDEGVTTTYYADLDGDTFGDPLNTTQACTQPIGFVTDNTDCDDSDASINPNGVEVCDGVDNDCDTQIDEGVTTTFYADLDGDTFGDPLNTIQACTLPIGFVTDNTDCDDTDASINPNGTEVCDGVDNDCDTQIDETGNIIFYADTDGDTFGDPLNTITACIAPVGYVSDNTDCDDTNASINPGAIELCNGVDDNCNTLIDEGVTTTYYADVDGDSFGDPLNTTQACTQPVGFVLDNTDCDDTNPAINTGAVETCDGVDNNCNTQIDEGATNTYYADLDGDTFGDPSNTIQACTLPVGFVTDNSDCDDTDASINPSGIEVCDGVDNDCDTQIDEGVTTTFYADLDGDTFGDPLNTTQACTLPIGFVTDNTDCDDTDASINPNGTEVCDGVDNDCDTQIDETGNIIFYADTDGDTFGDPLNTITACIAPVGYVSDNTDCDDTNASINPGATELCNGIDDNCNLSIDEGALLTFYLDNDGDTFGDPLNIVQACTAPAGYVSDNTDCDDANAAINPAAAELCDGIDNNCNVQIDEGVTTTYYADLDGDTFGDPLNTLQACTLPVGYVTDNTDCDDTDASINTNGVEVCDGVDNDCDTQIDEGVSTTYYADLDGDTFGDPLNTIQACSLPVGYVTDNTDCDDTSATNNPSGTEVCDGVDNDCDTQIDETGNIVFYADTDGDTFGDPLNTITACIAPVGYVSDNTDCDDTNASINPGAIELCNGIDDNCNLSIDEGALLTFYLDNDGDTFGDPLNIVQACTAPAGYVSDNTDCDDANATINPAATELCDGIDNNCNVQIDEGVTTTFYADLDGDTFGDPLNTLQACTLPVGYVTDNTDCDDTNASINTNGVEVCDGVDNDCNTLIDEIGNNEFYADLDGDTFGDPSNSIFACVAPVGYVADNTDCDDTNASINPNGTEVCDGVDNDCDTEIDETGNIEFYADLDGDTFGDPLNTITACVAPVGYVADNTDCDDSNAAINPLAEELCDGIDNDCDLDIDEGTTLVTFYEDLDGDGFGNLDVTVEACVAPIGFVSNSDDCDDFDFTVYPGAEELCDGIDNNCDDVIDEGLPSQIFYLDADFDGFGNPTVTIEACAAPFGFVDNDLDCNDGCGDCFPGAEELCDGFDNDCDEVIDNGLEQFTFYLDNDGDGFGDINSPLSACVAPPLYTDNFEDCDDSDSFIYPGADELCDGLDNDCDFVIDNGLDNVLFYADADGDSFGDPNVSILACVPPVGYVDDMSDCDDTNANVNLFAEEICDGLDNDCDTEIDEEIPTNTYYIDNDGDGFGDSANTIESCFQPTGYVENSDDCDDSNDAINPDATDVCDGIDNDCDLDIDEDAVFITYYEDLDSDGFGNVAVSITACSQPEGFVDNNLDCDDNNDAINPSVQDVCDGIDNDCDLDIDEDALFIDFYLDADNDGFGDISEMVNACEQPIGYVENALDCNDSDMAINPDQLEICDEIDNNCDGNINENITCEIFIPEGISPNGDGINDVFVIDGAADDEVIEVSIFNRWGALVYSSENYKNDWDGRSTEGAFTGDLPAGTYYYIIKVDGEEKVGYITLWR